MAGFTRVLGSLCLCAAVGVASADVRAEEAPADCALSLETSVGVFSDYMFRGFNLYDGISLQPSVAVAYTLGEYGTLSASNWMHFSAEGDRKAEAFTEMDPEIRYSMDFDGFSVSVGHVWYVYPDGDDDINDTAEVLAEIELDTLLSPTFSVWHDYRDFDSQYYALGFSHEFLIEELGEGFNVTPYATFGFASNAEDVYADNGLVTISEGVSSTMKLGVIDVTVSLNYTHKVDDETDNEFWSGIEFVHAF